MSELAVYDAPANGHLPARVGVPGTRDFDSWTAVASEVIKLANVIYDTPFVPDGLRSGPAVAAAILAGRELSLGPMTSLANIHVIKGKPALSALLMRALILAQGHGWRDIETTDTRAVIEGKRRGEAEWTRVMFTAEQAKQAGIQLGGYPQDKLYARATSRLARRKFADVIAGMPYSAEDLEDGEAGDVMLADDPGYRADREAAKAAANGHATKPAARTAQRRQRATPTAAAGVAAAPPAAGSATAQTAPAAAGLPPLPGEEEATETAAPATDSDDRAAPGWVGLIVKHFERLGVEDRGVRLGYTAQIAGLDTLASTKDLTASEAKVVLETLARCKDQERLIVLLDKRERDERAASHG